MDGTESGRRDLNLALGSNLAAQEQEGQSEGQDQGNGSRLSDETEDGDPLDLQPDQGKNVSSAANTRYSGGAQGPLGKWSNLFGVKPTSKSSFPKIRDLSDKKGTYVLEVPSEFIDHNIKGIAATLVGKFIGPRPNIDVLRIFTKKKWDLKG